MNSKELTEEAKRLLVEDEMVKQVGALMYGTTLCGMAMVTNALIPHLQESYEKADVTSLAILVVNAMQVENSDVDPNEVEISKLIGILEQNIEFLKKLEEG